MCTRQECISRLTHVSDYIRREFGVKSLCLFGSVARGESHDGSDVDVCVDMPPKAFKVLGLKSYLEDLLGSSVDVVRLTPRLDSMLCNEIKRDAITII